MVENKAMRRQDKQIGDRAEVDRIIDEAKVIRIGMVDGGRPYVVPMNFAREDDDIWLHAATEGRKLDCLRADPHVCVEVDRFAGLKTAPEACGWTGHYESVIGFGTAEIVSDNADKERGLRAIMRKYSGRGDWTFSNIAKTVVIRVRLESLTGKCSPPPA